MTNDVLADDAFDAALRVSALEVGQHRFRHRTKVHRFITHLGAGDPGQIQKIVNQLCHALGGRPDPVEQTLRVRIKLAVVVFD